MKKDYLPSFILFAFFEAIAVTLWLTKDNLFYLFNFTYIGGAIALGLFLYAKKVKNARRVVQFLVGCYMLFYLGVFSGENMQLEGFWYYLFRGVFEAATIHYAVAKIFGPLLFGRGWCGYACWTAMILDLLPYKKPAGTGRKKRIVPYIAFIFSFVYIVLLFTFCAENMEKIMLWSFLAGNLLYYGVGVALAYRWKDNRAFCKYVCPITVFLKPMSYFSAMRITCDSQKCVSCGKCKSVCMMEVDMTDNSRSRKNGTECILCMECVEQCPKKALKL